MSLESILLPFLNLTGSFNAEIGSFLFLLSLTGEILPIAIPVALETIWLLIGYQFGKGVLSIYHLILLWCTAQVGRQLGAMVLYFLARAGSAFVKKFYKKHFRRALTKKVIPFKILYRINLSIFSTTLSRLVGLRVPTTLTLGFKGDLKTLSLGILFSSLIWDGIFIFLGIVGTTVVPKLTHMFLYSLVGLAILYIIAFAVRCLIRSFSRVR